MLLELLTADTGTSLLVGLAAALVAVIVLRLIDDQRYPPGPYGWPFIGYFLHMLKNPHLKLVDLKKKYGPIYSTRSFSNVAVFLCDYPSMKECFFQEAAMGRPKEFFPQMQKETLELGAFHDLGWRDQRRFALHSLRDLGFGKTRMEGFLREEIEELLDQFASTNGEAIVPEKFLTPSASNVVASLMFGKRRKFDDPKRIFLDSLFKESRQTSVLFFILTNIPLLLKLLKALNIVIKRHMWIMEQLNKYISDEIEEHRKTLDPNNIRDFTDGYLLEIEKRDQDPRSTFKVPVLLDVITFFFAAGTETIQHTVDWLIYLSATYPEVQKRVQSEIDSVLGSERFPCRSDYLQMPYTEAVILETLRWRTSVPINLPRYTLEDTKVQSHVIPKNTAVVGVFWAINHDPQLWGEDVEEFKPERFLSEDGKQVKKPEYFIPFSIGRRSCPGEALANVELFLYYVAILQKFNIRFPEGFIPDCEGFFTFAIRTKPYKAIFELRK